MATYFLRFSDIIIYTISTIFCQISRINLHAFPRIIDKIIHIIGKYTKFVRTIVAKNTQIHFNMSHFLQGKPLPPIGNCNPFIGIHFPIFSIPRPHLAVLIFQSEYPFCPVSQFFVSQFFSRCCNNCKKTFCFCYYLFNFDIQLDKLFLSM